MSKQDEVLTFTQTIDAPPKAVYYTFTNMAAIRGWLCDNAQLDASENGRIYLHWNQEDYYVSGQFTALEPDTSLAFTWHGRGDAAATKVQVALAAENGGTQITLTHSGIGTGKEWAETRAELEKGWKNGLENLKAVLETGKDKRIYDRPMLGIFINNFIDEEQAAQLGLPATGVQIGGTVPGTRAESAGLQADDVITRMHDVEMTSFQSIGQALEAHKPEDSIEVVFYRDGQKHTTSVELSHRPVPDAPDSPADLAARVREVYDQLDAELDAILEGVSDQEAATPPAEGEWSVMQVLAHLILGERTTHLGIAMRINDQLLNAFPGNSPAPMEALSAVYPTLADMVALWKRTEAETVALVARLPEELLARKDAYIQIIEGLVWGIPNHTRGHYAQMRQAIAAVRE
ncbi:MAG: SRPBCC domain-containing protein [Anaerolineae bacterium]|jgi:uncharacterized protein YndB with AHSA1/START domain